jgi:putative ATP-binding cassette transporter
MNLLKFLLHSSRGIVALSVVAGVACGLSGIGVIALVQAELATARSPRALVWAFVGLCLVSALSQVVAQAAMVRLSQGSVSKLCLHLCRRILALPLERFEELEPGGLLALLTEDVAIVAGGTNGIPLLCTNVPIVLLGLAYVGWLSPVVLGCMMVCLIPAVAAYQLLGACALRQHRAARAGHDALVAHFHALVGGFRELKIHHGRRGAFLAEALAASEHVRDRTTLGYTLHAVAGSVGRLGVFGAIGLLLFVMPAAFGFSKQTLAGTILITLFLMAPLELILTWIPILGRARASLLKIEELLPVLEAQGTSELPRSCSRPLRFRESLQLAGATYAYHHEPDGTGFAIGPLDLSLRPGEVIFVVGDNGSGKTTLVKLVSGLYELESGAIVLDGHRVTAEECEDYRQLFSVVFADGYLFPTLLGLNPLGLDARARNLLERLDLAGLVQVKAGAFSTLNLSQGQRRRLSLLAACLEDRPICIFDEWAANQDAHFRKVFYLELIPELKARGKALLVITHDEDYFDAADRVVKLHDGQLIDVTPVLVEEELT